MFSVWSMISHFVVRFATRQFGVLRGLVSWSDLDSHMWYHLWTILQLSLHYLPYSRMSKWFCLSTWIIFSRIIIYFSSCKCCLIVDGLPSQFLLHSLTLWTKGHWIMGTLPVKKTGMKGCISILILYSTSVNKSVLNNSVCFSSNLLISYVGFIICNKCSSTWYPTWVTFLVIGSFYRIWYMKVYWNISFSS